MQSNLEVTLQPVTRSFYVSPRRCFGPRDPRAEIADVWMERFLVHLANLHRDALINELLGNVKGVTVHWHYAFGLWGASGVSPYRAIAGHYAVRDIHDYPFAVNFAGFTEFRERKEAALRVFDAIEPGLVNAAILEIIGPTVAPTCSRSP